MTEVSTAVLSHVVVFMDGSTMDITEKAFEAIMSVDPETKAVNIKGQRIALSSISKILTRDEFYEQYPDRKPAQPMPTVDEAIGWDRLMAGDLPKYTPEKRERAKEGLMKGLQRFIDKENARGIPTPKAQALLEHMKSGKKADAYATAERFDPNKETWPEFSQRVGISH
jgi:hypothetical protein